MSLAQRALTAAVATVESSGKRSFEFRRKALIKTHARQKTQLGADDPRLARAIFTLRETAGYLDVPKSSIQRWARPPEAKHPLITCFPRHGREATVPFIGFSMCSPGIFVGAA